MYTLNFNHNLAAGLVSGRVPGNVLHAGHAQGERTKSSRSLDHGRLPVVVVEDGLVPLNVLGGGGAGFG